MPNLFNKNWTRQELQRRVPDMSQLAFVRPSTLSEGRSEGIAALDFQTGSGFQFTVLPGRGLDISQASFRGIPLCWRAYPGEVAAPYFGTGPFGWPSTAFGGLMSTGGLASMGLPCVEQGNEFGIHGNVSNLPASNVWSDAEWDGDQYKLWARGKIVESEALTKNLVLTREISTEMGASHFTIRDNVENRTHMRSEHMMLYHFNFGFPILSADSRLLVNSESIEPRDEESAKQLANWDRFESPKDGRPHQLFYHRLHRDFDGKSHAMLVGMPDYSDGPVGIYLSYSHDTLPWLANWKCMVNGDYVTGIEPANAWLQGRAAEREAGRLQYLEPWASVDYEVTFGVLNGRNEINEFAEKNHLPTYDENAQESKS
jgi:hypothetical protein